MATDSAAKWVIRDVTPGRVTIMATEPGNAWNYRVLAEVRATVMSSAGATREIRAEGRACFDESQYAGEATAVALSSALESGRLAARAFCDTANAETTA